MELDMYQEVRVETKLENGNTLKEVMPLYRAVQQWQECTTGMTGMVSVTIYVGEKENA